MKLGANLSRWFELGAEMQMAHEFLPTKRSNVQENGVREAHEVSTRQGAHPVRES